MRYDSVIKINGHEISFSAPVYFIADLASNHDGNLDRAKKLIYLAKEAGANAVKFQHFLAEKIVSDYGFRNLNNKMGHQKKWKKSVFEIYKRYECNRKWTIELYKISKKIGIDFLSSPYDFEAVDILDKYLPAYKIGSGDITWIEMVEYIARKNKPVILATGASTIEDVKRAVNVILKFNRKIVLLQCNTNYTGSLDNYRFINLRVLETYSRLFPGIIFGLSDHTPSLSTVLGSVALGARVIEKHFTDDNRRLGPDHSFSLNSLTWREMVNRTRELEKSLGNGEKKVEENENETVVIQRRSIRLTKALKAGMKITKGALILLRPSPPDSIPPYKIDETIGKILIRDKKAGEHLGWKDLLDNE